MYKIYKMWRVMKCYFKHGGKKKAMKSYPAYLFYFTNNSPVYGFFVRYIFSEFLIIAGTSCKIITTEEVIDVVTG